MHDADRSLGLRGTSRGCEPIPLFSRENMTLDEDVDLENNAHRCILDPVCASRPEGVYAYNTA